MNHIKKAGKRCYIDSCRKSVRKVSSLHEFPSNAVVRKKWFESIGLSKEEQENVPDKALVCNLHFTKDCYKQTPSGRKILKCEACPTLFLNRPTNNSGNTPAVSSSNISSSSLSKHVELNNCTSKQIESSTCSDGLRSAYLISCTANMGSRISDRSSQVNLITLDDIKKYKGEIRLLKQRIKRLTEKEKKLVDLLQKANEAVNNPYYKTLLKIKNDTETNNNSHATFLLDQINNYGKQKPRFSKLTLGNCIRWRRRSLKGYKFCQSTLLKLPSTVTIDRYLRKNRDNVDPLADIEASCLKPEKDL